MGYFVYSGSEKHINGALNMVDFYIFSSFEKLNHTSKIGGDSQLHRQYDLCWAKSINGKSINGLLMHAERAHYGT